ncbi:MAG: tail fiber domain-containing protein, partial [Bacteroidia bacterium]
QSLSISGSDITLSNGGGTVTVPSSADNLGNHSATTDLDMNRNIITDVSTLSTISGDSYDKLRVWNSSNFTIGMHGGMSFGFLNSWATTFTMFNNPDQGWVWRDANDAQTDGAMSLTTDGRLTLKSTARFQSLAGTGNRMVIADANGDLSTQAVPATGANNGLNLDGANIQLGGLLIETTTITAGPQQFNINLSSTGDFNIQDNGITHFQVADNGNTYFGGDVFWRDENTGGTSLMSLFDDGNDGRLLIFENGLTSVDLDANTQFVFNEQGLDRDFRVESDADPEAFVLNAGTGRVGIGTNSPTARLQIHDAGGTNSLNIIREDANVVNTEILGSINFDATDGGVSEDYSKAPASIVAVAEGDFGDIITSSILGFTVQYRNRYAGLSFRTGQTRYENSSSGNRERMRINASGTVSINDLAGTGDRMVVANANGDLSTQAFPSQSLSISGRDITLSNGGGTVTVPSSLDNLGNHSATTTLNMGANDIIIGTNRYIETADGDQNIQISDDNPSWYGETYGGVTRFFGDGLATDNKLEAGGLQLLRKLTVNSNAAASGTAGSGAIEIGTGTDQLRLSNNEIITNTGRTLSINADNNGDVEIDGSTFIVDASLNRVGIGSVNQNAKLYILPGNENYGIRTDHVQTTSGTTYGLNIDLDNNYTGSASTYGARVDGYKEGGGGNVYGVYGSGRNYNTSGISDFTYGVYAYGYRSSFTPSSTTYALYATQLGNATTEWAGYFSGNVYTTGSYLPSDRKLKTHVTPYTGALQRLMQLGTYTYRYDTEKYFHMNLPEDDQIGLIANDVAQLYPHLTKKVVQPAQRMPLEDAIDWLGEGGNYTVDEEDDEMAIVGEEVTFEGVNYAGMVPVLVQSIKEQQQMIEEQKQENQAQQALILQLEARLRALEAQAKPASSTTEQN